MDIRELPQKYQDLWRESLKYLDHGRPGDSEHAAAATRIILIHHVSMCYDLEVLVPAAMMHDLGHSAALPEHLERYEEDGEKLDGDFACMLVGAVIAGDLLEKTEYDRRKASEILDMIGMHDADRLSGQDWRGWYDTENKKVFHDMDMLTHYCRTDFEGWGGDPVELRHGLQDFFCPEIREIAQKNLSNSH